MTDWGKIYKRNIGQIPIIILSIVEDVFKIFMLAQGSIYRGPECGAWA